MLWLGASLHSMFYYAYRTYFSKIHHKKGINFRLLENLLRQIFLIPNKGREIIIIVWNVAVIYFIYIFSFQKTSVVSPFPSPSELLKFYAQEWPRWAGGMQEGNISQAQKADPSSFPGCHETQAVSRVIEPQLSLDSGFPHFLCELRQGNFSVLIS